MSQTDENKPHYLGHRQRLRERYINNGIESLHEHEVVELLLFYAMPRVDTKPLAHKLIDHFGSLKGVLSASHESLKTFGLTDNCAALVSLARELSGYIKSKEITGQKFCDYAEIGKLVASELEGKSDERMMVLFLDAKGTAIGMKTLGEGSANARVNLRDLTEECFSRNASKIVLAHNHPSGNLKPSADDYIFTTDIEETLSRLGIALVEHYIVADGTYLGIKHHCERSNFTTDKG